VPGRGVSPARRATASTGSVDDMFSFTSKKEASAFFKFVEDGVASEKSLQRVSTVQFFLSREMSSTTGSLSLRVATVGKLCTGA